MGGAEQDPHWIMCQEQMVTWYRLPPCGRSQLWESLPPSCMVTPLPVALPTTSMLLQTEVILFSRVSAHGRLKLTGQKTRVGIYIEKPFICITHVNHGINKNGGGWALTWRWALTQENTVPCYGIIDRTDSNSPWMLSSRASRSCSSSESPSCCRSWKSLGWRGLRTQHC